MIVCSVFVGSCNRSPDRTEGARRLTVVTTLFPVYDFAKNVGGEQADVSLLLPPGVEPHGFEPKPGDVMRIESADLFIYTGEQMEPWAAGILKGFKGGKPLVVDSSAEIDRKERDRSRADAAPAKAEKNHGHGHRTDPHIWLDLDYARSMVGTILGGYRKQDPARGDYYAANAARYTAKLAELDARFRSELGTCRKRVIIHGGHFAFNYLAQRYGLTYVSAYGGSPDAEPTARKLMELERLLRKYDVRYIYFEELITPRVAEIIAKETGASLLPLHGAHNVTREELAQGVTFIGIMENNLQNLKKGLECQ
jgi:zinc transport system substrate-binding protein